MAWNVIIWDILLFEFDLSIFWVEGGLYEYQWYLLLDWILVVEYLDILLFDSISNELESYGFFVFFIQFFVGIFFVVFIENWVGIYFDFNFFVIINMVIYQIEKLVLGFVVYVSFCLGVVYLGQVLYVDIILEECFVVFLWDSVVWYYVDVLILQDIIVVEVGLVEAGWWEGVFI